MFQRVVYCVVLVLWLSERGEGRVEPLPGLPPEMYSYLNICNPAGNLTEQPGEITFWLAAQQYVSQLIGANPDMTNEEIEFVKETIGSSIEPFYRNNGRQKRQTVQPRIRREMRMMSIEQRTRYFNALNRMKNDRRLTPNVYDVIASFHEGANMARAHGGPAFPGWHRMYLWILESFLRVYDPSVTIPYWASDFDEGMANPRASPVFSNGFFGPGVGLPTSGPFRGWQQANPNTVFRRNFGFGQLFTYEGIQNILRRRRNRDILLPTALADSNFEGQHGGPHVWVGGSMNNLNEAARDPLFFSHHSYVDKIWEDFRRQQTVNPATDYPFNPNDPRFRAAHAPNGMMGFFPNGEVNIDFTQITGYSNIFFQLVQYEPVTCPACGNSPYLFCDVSQNPARCVSRTTAAIRAGGQGVVDTLPGVSVTGQRRRRAAVSTEQGSSGYDDVCSSRPNWLANDVNVNTVYVGPQSPIGQPDNLWAYVPIKVIAKRPIEYNEFQKYNMYNMPHGDNGFKNTFFNPGNNKGYSSCTKRLGNAGRVKVVSYGTDHYSYSEEILITDNRLGVSMAVGALPVLKSNGANPERSIVAAFDECGRVCKPYCKPNSLGRHNQYFSGAISVSSKAPLQYASSYGDALLDVWDITDDISCPALNDYKVPLTFFCDNTDPYVWYRHPGRASNNAMTPGASINLVCVVSSTCIINVPCGDCQDYMSILCNNGRELAICIDGTYRLTTVIDLRHKPYSSAKHILG